LILEGIFPFNDSSYDPNVRGEAPAVQELHQNVVMGAMVAGVKTATVKSKVTEVWGIIPLRTTGAGANEVLGFSAALGSSAGTVDITINSTKSTATDNLTLSFIIVGRILPTNVV